MLTIPENETKREHYEDIVTKRVIEQLNRSFSCCLYAKEAHSEEIAKTVAKRFVYKGYYAKISYFLNGAMQKLIVSKRPVRISNARLIREEIIS